MVPTAAEGKSRTGLRQSRTPTTSGTPPLLPPKRHCSFLLRSSAANTSHLRRLAWRENSAPRPDEAPFSPSRSTSTHSCTRLGPLHSFPHQHPFFPARAESQIDNSILSHAHPSLLLPPAVIVIVLCSPVPRGSPAVTYSPCHFPTLDLRPGTELDLQSTAAPPSPHPQHQQISTSTLRPTLIPPPHHPTSAPSWVKLSLNQLSRRSVTISPIPILSCT